MTSSLSGAVMRRASSVASATPSSRQAVVVVSAASTAWRCALSIGSAAAPAPTRQPDDGAVRSLR